MRDLDAFRVLERLLCEGTTLRVRVMVPGL
jgi:hypothetical protein